MARQFFPQKLTLYVLNLLEKYETAKPESHYKMSLAFLTAPTDQALIAMRQQKGVHYTSVFCKVYGIYNQHSFSPDFNKVKFEIDMFESYKGVDHILNEKVHMINQGRSMLTKPITLLILCDDYSKLNVSHKQKGFESCYVTSNGATGEEERAVAFQKKNFLMSDKSMLSLQMKDIMKNQGEFVIPGTPAIVLKIRNIIRTRKGARYFTGEQIIIGYRMYLYEDYKNLVEGFDERNKKFAEVINKLA